eukprot:1400229-Amphidinium_carterae.1
MPKAKHTPGTLHPNHLAVCRTTYWAQDKGAPATRKRRSYLSAFMTAAYALWTRPDISEIIRLLTVMPGRR